MSLFVAGVMLDTYVSDFKNSRLALLNEKLIFLMDNMLTDIC